MTSQQWRDRFAVRLGLPLPFLRAGPTSCDCHDALLSVAFANQIGDAIMVRGADARRRRNRSAGRYATGARA